MANGNCSSSGVSSAANATAEALQSSGFQLGDKDIEKIVQALGSRLPGPIGFHVSDFALGMLLTVGIAAAFYYRSRRRYLWRNNEREAVETLKNMDDETIKRMLGESNLPSWVNFPDFERVGWINTVLSQLWPYVNSAVSQQFREMLAPLLRQNKPSWIASIKLFRFDLGDAAPQANGVKVYSHNEEAGEILIEVDFSWVGNQDVQLTIKPIPKHLGPLSPAGQLLSSIIRLRAGIERIIINGRVRFMWKPLLGELPIVGGMQVALVEMPKFSFDVTLYGGDVSMVPGLEQWLTTFMKDTVFRPYILPERYTCSFSEDAESEELQPKAILFLKVIGAKDVPKMDLFSASDPYVRMFVRHTIQLRTTVKENNSTPTWNQDFKFLVHDVESQVLTCILMDYDNYNPDDEIGRATLLLKDLEPEKTQDLWLEVNTVDESDGANESGGSGKAAGIIGKFMSAEQKVAEQGEKLWKKLPGIKNKDKFCQLHLEATLYKLDSRDLEAAIRQDQGTAKTKGRPVAEAGQPTSSGPQKDHGEAEKAASEQHAEGIGEAGAEVKNGGEPQGLHKRARQAGKDDLDETVGEETDVQSDVRSQALDTLKGGILFVKPRKADSLVHKPWYKGSFLHSMAQLEVSICGQCKTTASAKGSSPVFTETLEFLLGGHDLEKAENERLKIEVWDHRLHLNSFRGGCSIVLKDIIEAKRIKNTLRLTGVRHGELSLELYWVPALESGRTMGKSQGAKAAEKN